MHAEILIVLAILIFGCAAFLLGTFYLVCQLCSLVWRGMVGLVRPAKGDTHDSWPPEESARVCPNPTCQHIEFRDARFCSACGARLVERLDT